MNGFIECVKNFIEILRKINLKSCQSNKISWNCTFTVFLSLSGHNFQSKFGLKATFSFLKDGNSLRIVFEYQ